MDQLSAMRVYASVIEERGFTAASRVLGMPLPTVCRKIAELETKLGVQLLIRSTRKVSPTEGGLRYYEDVRRILEEIESAERYASGEFNEAKGLLTVTAPSLLGRRHVLPIVHEFMQLHKDIEVRLFFTNQVLDLAEEHVDVAFRLGTIAETSMEAIPLGTQRIVTCASRAYLSEHGKPMSPKDVSDHTCIPFIWQSGTAMWRYRRPSGKSQLVEMKSKLQLNSVESTVDSVMQGYGIAQFYAYQAAPGIAAGILEILLEEFEAEPAPASLVLPRSYRKPQKIGAFIDFAAPKLRAILSDIDAICERSTKPN